MKKSYLVISEQNVKKIVKFREILFFERLSTKVIIHTFNNQIEIYSTLSNVEKKINNSNFYRTHRSYLVNLANVSEIEVIGDRSYMINFFRGDKKAYISRERYSGFCDRLYLEGIML
ncbi:MAG: LytTR family transcriptional regulator DNA-binding domain-containing protein [Halanaerobiales bacterium]|nr:LytTR family transcriptional regulator DNA-binding domain-containing protein [Halanaerobiales bacterium]